MQFSTLALTILAGVLAVQASPVAEPQVTTPACNADYSPSSCGACHYWRNCLDSRTQEWIVPCPACDHTSWCNCTAPAGQNNPPA